MFKVNCESSPILTGPTEDTYLWDMGCGLEGGCANPQGILKDLKVTVTYGLRK